MLSRLAFKNFKAWKDAGSIRLAPLTVLFGTNSAGKTSIPQLLLLLKQTAESPDRQRALQLGDSRSLVDLGTYDDAVHNHDVDQPLEFAIEWTLDRTLTVADPVSGWKYEGDALGFSATVRADKRHQPVIERLEYHLKKDETKTLDLGMRLRTDARQSDARKGREFDLVSSAYELRRHPGRALALPNPVRFYGFPDEATAYFQNTAFAADLVLELERMLRSIFYVGPLREYPKRLYLWSGEVPDHVGAKGDRAIEAILAGADRTFNWKPKQRSKPLPALVAERLQSMGLIREFEVKALGERRKEYEVLVRTGSQLPKVKLTDVGFGVSQVLPVIVECFYVPRRSVVIFEQPEIHLHPRVQADLADLFIDAIHAREDGAARECQFIIESHSEHFLRRLQRRIAEEELSKDESALYFVHSDGATARIEELELDPFGNILNWPESFFGDEMADVVARTEAQARRRLGGDR
jgi:predicted ATPase